MLDHYPPPDEEPGYAPLETYERNTAARRRPSDREIVVASGTPAGDLRSSGRDHGTQLDMFFAEGLITEVLGLVKIGKEASVYCCQAGSELGGGLVAAKVYRRRQYRFKNDAIYQEGRTRGMEGHLRRALKRKSEIGRQVQTGSWINHEYETLDLLYEAGADVPRPLASRGDAILMEYIGDSESPAPRLVQVAPDREEAEALFEALLANVELWLATNRVHADLSPHNVLYWDGRLVVIDFPQAIDPRFNSSARDLLHRDVDNVCRYFQALGVPSDPWRLAEDLWRRFLRADL